MNSDASFYVYFVASEIFGHSSTASVEIYLMDSHVDIAHQNCNAAMYPLTTLIAEV